MDADLRIAAPPVPDSIRRSAFATFSLCVLASLADGFDLQATGITAMKYKAEFGFTTAQLSSVFVANNAGLLVGAIAGGWLADRIGRRWVMIGSMLLFAIGSLWTAMLSDGTLFAGVRFFTGAGLGAAVTNIIALVAETGPARTRATRVTVLTASTPLGGAIAAGTVAIYPDIDWRTIFEIGGWWPLAIGLAMILWLPESRHFEEHRRTSRSSKAAPRTVPIGTALFGEGRAVATLMLWISFFFCVLAIHLVMYWLPSLLVGQGYTPRQAAIAACMFPVGGAAGSALLGLMMGRLPRRAVVVFAFSGLVLSVAALALSPHVLAIMFTAAFFAGFFVIGSQFLLYGLSPTYYPVAARGTGVGAAVAVGRMGSIAGPLMAGLLLQAGQPAGQVLASILPGVVLAFVAAMILAPLPVCEDD